MYCCCGNTCIFDFAEYVKTKRKDDIYMSFNVRYSGRNKN